MRSNQDKIRHFLRELAADFRWTQPFAMLCLMTLSALFIYSATSRVGGGVPDEVKRQCAWFGVGIVGYLLAALVDYRWLCRKSWLIYIAVLGLLGWVLKFGREIYGARRWITSHGFTIQPSEFAKLSVLMALCYWLSRSEGRLGDRRRFIFAALIALVPAALIHKQPDLGTALTIVALLLMLLFLARAPLRIFGVLAIIAFIGAGVLGYETYRYAAFRRDRVAGKVAADARFKSFLHLKEYQLNRVLGVVAPDELDRLNEGWNIHQSLIAIGSGRIEGKGWTKGNVTRGGYLPRTVSLNDFIFAVFAEEAGFLGSVVLLGLYGTLLFGGVRIALQASDQLGSLLAGGVTFLLFFHIFVNMGMTLGILPVVGVPLPLMSYGGSFVLVCMVALGMLQSVWLHRKPY